MITIAKFLGAKSNHVLHSGAHAFKGAKKFNLLMKLDPHYLEKKVNEYCRDLMDEFFPDVDVWTWQSREGSHTELITSMHL
jgi:hypothetical protein